MEVEESNRFWSSATNWIVFHGSLKNSVSFESPISLMDGDDVQDTDDSSRNSNDQVVLMHSPSPDSGPCEIKISLGQRHEIRQVYVRSTARIYEIYYAPEPQSINEYLCTVRCGIAAKEYATLDASNTEEAISAHMEESTEPTVLSEDKIKNDNTNGTDEDGWVEVKVPDSPLLDSRTSSLAKRIDQNIESGIQDFYEATAEITDACPCISVTLRLLSLQTKGSVHLGEIYIFAEPVESADSDHQVGPVDNLAGRSLMSMLVPTLMQLSKTGRNKIQDMHVSDIRTGLNHQDGDSKETESMRPNIGRTKEAHSSMPDGKQTSTEDLNKGSAESTRLEHVPGTGQGPEFVTKENDWACRRMERTLDHLVSRVGRIEAFCLRFEENMLKPFSSIETRLQRLEQQLELLTTRSQSSELNPSTRITAPEFSSNESESNSQYNDRNSDCHCGVLELASKDTSCTRASEFLHNESESNALFNDRNDDCCCGELESSDRDTPLSKAFSPIDDESYTVVAPQLFPRLIVTAPEFSNDDGSDAGDSDGDRNCNGASETDNKVCHTDKPSSTIDDALALALAGFLSSTSVQTPKINQTSIFKAPDFPDEEHGNNYTEKTSLSTRTPCERAADSSICFGENNTTDNVKDLYATSGSSSEDKEMQMKTLIDDGSIKAAEVETLVKQGLLQEEGTEGSCKDNNTSRTFTQDKHDLACRDDNNCRAKDTSSHKEQTEEDTITNPTDESGMGTVNRAFIDSQLFVEENYDNSSDIFSKGTVACTEFTITDIEYKGCDKDDSENVFKQSFNCIVDFELPVLDVKFVPKENWNSRSSLDTLLGEMPKVEDSCSKDDDDAAIDEQSQPFLEDELMATTLDDQLLVDVDDHIIKTVLSRMGSDQIQDPILDDNLLVGVDDLTNTTVVSNMGSEQIQDPSSCSNQELPSLI